MFYIYKDTFLSGWGYGEGGSYVISKGKLSRSDFKLRGQVEHLRDLTSRFLNRAGRHIIAVRPNPKRGPHAFTGRHALNAHTLAHN